MAVSLKAVSAITLFVEDISRSKEFYERVFDADVVDEEEGTVILKFDNVFMRLLARDEAEKEVMGKVSLADVGSGSGFELAVRVDDAATALAALEEREVPIAFGPVDRPWGVRHVGFRDPDGHLWVLGSDIPD